MKWSVRGFGSRLWAYFDPKCLLPQLAAHMPARTQGYPWQLVYSTGVHGSSLKTLYRKTAGLDSPVLLVIKDMHKKVCIFLITPNLFFFLFFPDKKCQDLLLTSHLGLFRCLGLFLQIHSESVNPAMAQEKPFYSASTPTSRWDWNSLWHNVRAKKRLNAIFTLVRFVFSQVYRWSGQNTYFVSGDLESLQIGGGG